jgi:hypothetical protein
MLSEFERRTGDPNLGGSAKSGLVTSYRQESERCAGFLVEHGPSKGAVVASGANVEQATTMMRRNVYGWFTKIDVGIYDVSELGRSALDEARNEQE